MISTTGPAFLALRGVTRKLGINALIGRVLNFQGYEAKLAETMLAAVRPGDRVWDVGANVGHYTRQFSDLVGPDGAVAAFEPSSHNRAHLEHAVSGLANVRVLPVGLSNVDEQALFVQGDDALGATSHISTGEPDGNADHYPVDLVSGDGLVAGGSLEAPTFIKIDVEGFEPEVIDGLSKTLESPQLREIFIEVHFTLLAARSLKLAAREIEETLRSKGFQLRWLDPSHLHAHRPT